MDKLYDGPREREAPLPEPQEIADEIVRVAFENGYKVTTVVVYGSYSRGEQEQRSDADVIVVSPDFEEGHPLERAEYIIGSRDFERYPTFDDTPLRPEEFYEKAAEEGNIVRIAAQTGITFEYDEEDYSRVTSDS